MTKKIKLLKHYKIEIQGKVQGVFFRFSTKVIADQLGVKGFVQNQLDGSVFIEAEGDDFAMENFMEWCHEGPDKAEVESVKTVEGPLVNYKNFEIIKLKTKI